MHCIAFRDGAGVYWSSELAVSAQCTDGINRQLDQALNEVLSYWCSFLRDVGLGDFGPFDEIPIVGSTYWSREEAAMTGPEITQGLAYSQYVQFLEFDDKLGRAVPVNLQAVPRDLLRLVLTIDFRVNLADGREILRKSIELSEQESQEISKMEDSTAVKDCTAKYLREREESVEKWIKEAGYGEGKYNLQIDYVPSFKLGPSFPVLVSEMKRSDR